MTENQKKLLSLLKEMFQFDQADLDFGIYRIMRMKREEISRFIEKDLPAQITEGLQELISVSAGADIAEIDKQIADAKALNISEAAKVPIIAELEVKKKAISAKMDISSVEADVYNHLTNFFSRYYDEGDFISQRRYKDGAYAIPYEGEEVKLHWANADQYYVKTSEYFKDYTFKTAYGDTVRFKLVEAETERDNNKANEKRFFQLHIEKPFEVVDGVLTIYMEYKNGGKKNQDECIEEVVKAFSDVQAQYAQFSTLLAASDGKTLLERQLKRYTARNTFDYFIHKDLGKFLRRELDFYIKNDVIFLDDIDEQDESKTKEYLTKAKVIRKIAQKIIAFLAQIEDFQKKLYLKKKFVVETNYCITLDRIPEDMYPEIAANDAQRQEWMELYAIDDVTAYSNPLTVDFLKQNKNLVLDTKYFTTEFKERLIASIDNLDEETNGLLIHSENFQALNLLQEKYREKIKCVYIDPPYNTGDDGFFYKDNLMHSSWASFINDRINISKRLMTNDGKFAVSIDDREIEILLHLCKSHFNASKIIAVKMSEASGVKMTSVKNQGTIPKYKEYLIINAKEVLDNMVFDYIQKNEWDKEYNKFIEGLDKDDYEKLTKLLSSDEINEEILDGINTICARWNLIGLGEQERKLGIKDTELLKWRMENAYKIVRTAAGTSVKEIALENYHKYPNHKIFCALSKRDKIPYFIDATFDKNAKKPRVQILFAIDNLSVHPGDFWSDINTTGLEAEGDVDFKNGKKPLKLIERIIKAITCGADFVLDFFAGSGTTGHAVINLNRKDGGNRKYILVEMGQYFDTVTKPRIEKVIYSEDWKDGKPVSRVGSSYAFKYLRLESYEDTLNNIVLSGGQYDMLGNAREGYLLSYMLDAEAEGSSCLLNINKLDKPFDYKMNITRNLESLEQSIDLVETFNYLIGLTVARSHALAAFDAEFSTGEYGVVYAVLKTGGTYKFKAVEGTLPNGDKALVIWREMTGDIVKDNAVLDAYFRQTFANARSYKKIFVNCDNNLQNLCTENKNWRVILIDEEMKKRMFEYSE